MKRTARIFFAVLLLGFTPVIINAQDVYHTADIASKNSELLSSTLPPPFGNTEGNITIIEFYDYQCVYCKLSQEGIEQLLRDDGNIKLILKDFPKLGPLS